MRNRSYIEYIVTVGPAVALFLINAHGTSGCWKILLAPSIALNALILLLSIIPANRGSERAKSFLNGSILGIGACAALMMIGPGRGCSM